MRFKQLLTALVLQNKIGDSDRQTLRKLQRLVKYTKAAANQGLKYTSADIDLSKIVLSIDASLGNALEG